MWVNLEEEMTLEQIVEKTWHKLLPAMQARIQALASRRGCTVQAIMLECREMFLKALENPARRQAFYDKIDREQHPCGKDPLLLRAKGDL